MDKCKNAICALHKLCDSVNTLLDESKSLEENISNIVFEMCILLYMFAPNNRVRHLAKNGKRLTRNKNLKRMAKEFLKRR